MAVRLGSDLCGMDWPNFFAEMPDFRVDRQKKHHLVDILVIALCALLSGADDFAEIAAYGRRKDAFLRPFLPLANSIPSHDTFTRVFRHRDTAAFGRCLCAWPRRRWPLPPPRCTPSRGTARCRAAR